tara:strand:- start:3240 stop:4214 length:975 start_codon:yes stop_codon:yes gene_type:complete
MADRVFIFFILFCLFTTANATELTETVGKILLSGDISDRDIKELEVGVYNQMGIDPNSISEECSELNLVAGRQLINSSQGGSLDIKSVMEAADKCYGYKKGAQQTKKYLPPLPRFNNAGWIQSREKFKESYYSIKSVKKGNHYIGWSTAQRECWSDHRGRLVAIEDKEEDDFVKGLVKKHGNAYIGVFADKRLGGGIRFIKWAYPVAAGRDRELEGYNNWEDKSKPELTFTNSSIVGTNVHFWGVYEDEQSSFWGSLFNSDTDKVWKLKYPGELLDPNKVPSVFICEWDKKEWENVKSLRELERNQSYNNVGGKVKVRNSLFIY